MKNTRLFPVVLISRVLVAGLALSVAVAPELYAAPCDGGECVVDIPDDTDDAAPGNGVCADTNDQCSLRAAIQECNADSANRIIVPSNLGVYFVERTNRPLKITTRLTIVGNGPGLAQIDGRGATTPLKILNPAAQGIVEISGVSIQKGLADTDHGGGIFIAQGSSLRLNKSEVTGNTAGFGAGGIMNRGYLELNDCKVKCNRNTNGGGGTTAELSGGMTNMPSGEAHIIHSEITNNCGIRGGGIENLGRLSISSGSTLRGNRAVEGGAIANHNFNMDQPAQLFISNSTIEGNFAAEDNVKTPCSVNPATCAARAELRDSNVHQREWNGGGISNGVTIIRPAGCRGNCNPPVRTFGDVEIDSSTINDNKALRGGGIANGDGGHAVIDSSTISRNTATRAGGIYNTGPGRRFLGVVELTYSTITKNMSSGANGRFLELGESTLGGGIANEAFVLMEATILADNTAHTVGDHPNDCFSRTDHSARPIASFCNNLFGVLDDNCNMEDVPPCDYWGTPDAPLDPVLGALAFWPSPDNGGPTKTHALLPGSPAINAVVLGPGNHFCPNTDQRGRLRPAGPFCDIGAYEFNASLP